MSIFRPLLGVAALLAALVAPITSALAQGVTTGSMTGTVQSAGKAVPGATVSALHLESGTRYSAITRADGRYLIPAMRVGGPYRVTVRRIGLQTQDRNNVFVTLGQGTEVNFDLSQVAVSLEAVRVAGQRDPVMSPDHTGAATTVQRDQIAAMPTISGRLESIVRLTPQAGGSNNPYSFVGQDPRLNNITIDGSYFNQSFGLANTPGERTGVAPVSLSAVEQVQVNVAPYDVRQGNFVGANVNSVTRSGTNQFHGSIGYQVRNQNYIGRQAGLNPVDPGTTKYHNLGGWLSGPILQNKAFYFLNYEDDLVEEPGTTFMANTGTDPVGGNTTRVQASDLDALSGYLAKNFNYQTGPYQGYSSSTPAKRFLGKVDVNLSESNKLSMRYTQLDSKADVLLSNSSSLGFGSRRSNTTGLNFQASNYNILENIKSFVTELNSTFGGGFSNQLIAGYTTNNESRGNPGALFPFVDILSGSSVYTSFGTEPFTPNNELYYHTYQLQDNVSIFRDKHTFTLGVSGEKYHSLNVFFPGEQSVYVYNSLADFYTDANSYLANPNRTVSPVTLRTFQVRYANIPGQAKPEQPLDVTYLGAYGQDEWTLTPGVKATIGVRMDVPRFANTAYDNPNADALTFRDEQGNPVQYNSGKLPNSTPLWSPRIGINWDVTGDRSTQIRGGTGVFTGKPAYVWVSNQIGNTGMLTGFDQQTNTTARPFNPNPNAYKPQTVTGAPAASYELDVTDQNFKFPQVWRSNIAIDKQLPFGLVGTAEFIYNRDVNGIAYINANLPAAQSAYVGADARPRWTGLSCNVPTATPCVTRLNNAAGNQVTSAIVLKNENVGHAYNASGSLERNFENVYLKGAWSYGVSKNTVDPGSIASGSWTSNQIARDANNPDVAYSQYSPGHRLFLAATLHGNPFGIGTTSVAMFNEWRTQGNASYTFSGDANGDGNTGNDLIYVPRDTSEMYFRPVMSGSTVVFTTQQQQLAWENFINQDDYLRSHRGQYAERNGVFMPMIFRTDLSFSQEIARQIGGRSNGLEARLDILNFTNLVDHNWGVSRRFVTTTPLVSPSADPLGRLTYQLRSFNGQLIDHTYEQSANVGTLTSLGTADVYRLQLSLRFNF